MTHKPLTYSSSFGIHCATCGSLVDACGNVFQCRIDAKLEIDEAIRWGESENRLEQTAYHMLGKFLLEDESL